LSPISPGTKRKGKRYCSPIRVSGWAKCKAVRGKLAAAEVPSGIGLITSGNGVALFEFGNEYWRRVPARRGVRDVGRLTTGQRTCSAGNPV